MAVRDDEQDDEQGYYRRERWHAGASAVAGLPGAVTPAGKPAEEELRRARLARVHE